MNNRNIVGAFLLGALVCIGLIALGYQLAQGIIHIKSLDRTVTVKGLSEREVPANVAIWPITFQEAGNDLNQLFSTIQNNNERVVRFLENRGFKPEEISVSPPGILDKQAEGYAGTQQIKFRYSGNSTITVYSEKVDDVRKAMNELVELGKQGIAIARSNYQTQTEFLYTKLNEIKPEMIEEATKNAREVAEKFARDSNSRLGKIKTARQGQFSINHRDNNTPHIKNVRVVSTVEYYLSD
ncbi:MAG TPA: SIMPL domain-containing protein [Desulfobacterales bacterium]